MVRVTECFECGAQENEAKLIFTFKGPSLYEKCNEKLKIRMIRDSKKISF